MIEAGQTRRVALDEIGDIGAPAGSRPWSVALRRSMRAAIKDERSNAARLQRLMVLLSEHKGFRTLDGPDGELFPSFEAFCRAPMPWGLGYELDAINAIIDERKSAQARAQQPKELAAHGAIGRGRSRRSVTTSVGRDRGIDYLNARMQRDRPDALARVQSGDLTSHAAAFQAGIKKR